MRLRVAREKLLDIPLALPGCLREQRLMVLVRQVPRQHPRRGHAELTRDQHLEDAGKAASRARRLDAVVDGILGKMEHRLAVPEKRRESRRFVQPPRIELGQVDDERGRRLAFAGGHPGQVGGQRRIVEGRGIGHLHGSL